MSALPCYPHLNLSRRGSAFVAVFLAFAAALLSAQVSRLTSPLAPAAPGRRSGSDLLSHLPLSFEANSGQVASPAQYMAHTAGDTLLFAPSSVILLLASSSPQDKPAASQVAMQFIDSNPSASIEHDDALPGTVSYLLGSEQSRWQTALPTYSGITYHSLYPGINLHYNGTAGSLKGTYIVAPGADPTRIQWRYPGASNLKIDPAGNLVIEIQTEIPTSGSQISELAPIAWQEINGSKTPVSTGYVVQPSGVVSFRISGYDHTQPLVIDPTLAYSTYLGGGGSDDGIGIAVDSQGNTYVTGPTGSFDFPLQNPLQPYYAAGNDLFVTKISADGSSLIYSTYLGGNAAEISWGMAVDSEGSAYLAGSTLSPDYPVVNAFQPSKAGGEDVIVSKINPSGTGLVYSTYLGGAATDEAWNIAVSGTNAYITGKTNSTDFPVSNAYQPANAGGYDIFVTKLSSSGLSLSYSTYLGGTADEESIGVDVDAQGSAYISGGSHSTDYPLAHPFQPVNKGSEDVVLTKLYPSGDALAYSTYFGGTSDELPWGVSVTQAGDAFVTGVTNSPDFPVRRALQPTKGNELDGFVFRLSRSGSWVVYSTFLGGNGSYDAPYGIVVDESGNSFVTALIDSSDFPLRNPIQSTYGGNGDASVTMLDPLGVLLFSTYLGGSGEDFAWRVDLDTNGDMYTTGLTRSTNFPTANALQPANAGSPDAFVLKISGLPGPTPIPPSCNITFSDVEPGSTFYDYIRCLACEGLVSGYEDNTFRPNNPTSRGQLAKLVANAAGFNETIATQSFQDVPPASSFYPYIERLTSRSLVSGYPCGSPTEPCVAPGNLPYFRPGASVSRGQAAKIVSGAAAFPDAPPNDRQFQDIPLDHSFYRWIEPMASAGLVSGYPCGAPDEPCIPPGNLPYFRPANNITRGQTAKIVASTFLSECALQPPKTK